jgi:hypothetical protein
MCPALNIQAPQDTLRECCRTNTPASAKKLKPDPAKAVCLLTYTIVLLWLAGWFLYGYRYWEDDAFIHLEFARSLIQGRGFSFNGITTYGDTSPLWVFLLAGVHYLIPNWISAGKLLTVVGCGVALWALHVVAMGLAPKGTPPRLFAAILVVLLAINPYFVLWFLSGMEAPMAIGVGLWIIWAASVAEINWANFWIGCILSGFAPLLRPEFVFLDLVVAPFLLVRALRLTCRWSSSARIISVFSAMLTVALPLVLWLLYAHREFGTIVPNTSAAKRDLANGSVTERLLVVFTFGFPLVTVFTILFPALTATFFLVDRATFNRLVGKVRKQPSATWIIALWAAITCGFYIVNHTYVQTRYVLVLAPPLMLAILILIFSFNQRWLARTAYLAAAIGAAVTSIAIARPFISNKVEWVSSSRDLSAFVVAKLPPQKPIAIYAIGQLAFQSHHPIIDLGGITRPGVMPFVTSPERTLEWAKRQGAAYLVADDSPEKGAVLVYESSRPFAGWTIHLNEFTKRYPVRLWELSRHQ